MLLLLPVSDRVQSENFNNRLAFFYVLRVMCECLRMTTTTRVDSVSRSDPKMDIRTSATKCVQGNHKTTVSIAIEHTHTLVYLLPDRRLGSHLIKTMRHCDLLERKRESTATAFLLLRSPAARRYAAIHRCL